MVGVNTIYTLFGGYEKQKSLLKHRGNGFDIEENISAQLILTKTLQQQLDKLSSKTDAYAYLHHNDANLIGALYRYLRT